MIEQAPATAEQGDLSAVIAAAFSELPGYSHAHLERTATHHVFARIAEHYGLTWAEVNDASVPIPDEALQHLFTPHGWQILGLIYAAHYRRAADVMPVSVH